MELRILHSEEINFDCLDIDFSRKFMDRDFLHSLINETGKLDLVHASNWDFSILL